MKDHKLHEVGSSLERSRSLSSIDMMRRMAEEVNRNKEGSSLERSSSLPRTDSKGKMVEEVNTNEKGPSLEGSRSLPRTDSKGKMVEEVNTNEKGPSLEGSSSSLGTDRKGKMVEEVDRSKERELNELQEALVRFKNEVINKKKKPENWKIEDEFYIDHIEQIECIEQVLPRILAKDPSRERSEITQKIRKLGNHQISYDPLVHMNKVDVLIQDLEKLDPKVGDLLKEFKSKLDGHFYKEEIAKKTLEMEKKNILNDGEDIDKWIAKHLRRYKRFKEGYSKCLQYFDDSVNKPYLSKLLSSPKVGVEIAQKIKDLNAYQIMYDTLKSHSYEIDNLYVKIMKIIPDIENELRETSKLQKTLSRCKSALKLKNTAIPHGWETPDQETHERLQEMYRDHVSKIDHMKRMLPKLVAKELSESRERRKEKIK